MKFALTVLGLPQMKNTGIVFQFLSKQQTFTRCVHPTRGDFCCFRFSFFCFLNVQKKYSPALHSQFPLRNTQWRCKREIDRGPLAMACRECRTIFQTVRAHASLSPHTYDDDDDDDAKEILFSLLLEAMQDPSRHKQQPRNTPNFEFLLTRP